MKALLQRVSRASVTVDGCVVGEIGRGLLVLLGVAGEYGEDALQKLVDKVIDLRIFEDDAGKMNRSVLDVGGALLVVSQFTLLGDCRKGRRPSFIAAAPPEMAERLYERFCELARRRGVAVATGTFRAHMEVALVNDGPVTLMVEAGGDRE